MTVWLLNAWHVIFMLSAVGTTGLAHHRCVVHLRAICRFGHTQQKIRSHPGRAILASTCAFGLLVASQITQGHDSDSPGAWLWLDDGRTAPPDTGTPGWGFTSGATLALSGPGAASGLLGVGYGKGRTRVGHASFGTTMDGYTQALEQPKRQAQEQLADLIMHTSKVGHA